MSSFATGYYREKADHDLEVMYNPSPPSLQALQPTPPPHQSPRPPLQPPLEARTRGLCRVGSSSSIRPTTTPHSPTPHYTTPHTPTPHSLTPRSTQPSRRDRLDSASAQPQSRVCSSRSASVLGVSPVQSTPVVGVSMLDTHSLGGREHCSPVPPMYARSDASRLSSRRRSKGSTKTTNTDNTSMTTSDTTARTSTTTTSTSPTTHISPVPPARPHSRLRISRSSEHTSITRSYTSSPVSVSTTMSVSATSKALLRSSTDFGDSTQSIYGCN